MKNARYILILVLLISFYSYSDESEDDQSRITPYKGINVSTKLNNDNFDQWQVKVNSGFKYELVKNTNLFFTYSIAALWEMTENSSPFKDINHDLEFFWVTKFGLIPFLNDALVSTKLGYEHTSNGLDDESIDYEGSTRRSRSVHNLNIQPTFRFGSKYIFVVSPKFWINTVQRDNPDIGDYYGNFDLHSKIIFPNRFTLSSKYRANLKSGNGRTETRLTIPMTWPASWIFGYEPNTYWFFEYFEGYGETLLDYNVYTRSIRAGISLARE
ncbi:MAG: phospholipase A [Candidatus Delongbacteria bacterium]|jgi:outer membrane phospholipase A|nr:phospholipase A [Candidatus Delongbacteria bacterium]